MMFTTYEGVLARVEGLAASPPGEREILWLTDSQVVGVSRDEVGRLELFLAGMEIQARAPVVQEALMFHEWHRMDGPPLRANRLILPPAPHFSHVAVFLGTELLRNGVDEDLQRGFRATEPIIELAISRLELSEASLLGLAGELLLLEALCRNAERHELGAVVDGWNGWQHSLRDFSWNLTGVEVKTTKRDASIHPVQGLHQVEPLVGDNDNPGEHELLLVSIGLAVDPLSPNAFTIPELVESIGNVLVEAGLDAEVESFLSRVKLYGAESGFGYDHKTMSKDAPFITPFVTKFVRGYEMSDPDVLVLRTSDLVEHPLVDSTSIRFRLALPISINGLNPVRGSNQVARRILGI